MADGPPWRQTTEGLSLVVRLTPRGGRDALGGIETLADGRAILTARVRAPPTEGEANEALVRLLAKTLKLPASHVKISQGQAARLKTLLLRGDGAELADRLAAFLGAPASTAGRDAA